ncbi:MAG: AAA family ATPase [Lachnospiraceae bacterium]|nr:AAA family ATPase [Lachnospiraceae bacterium]
MIIKMAVADSNIDYIQRLISVLEGYGELQLSVYTERAALEHALTSKHFDVLLFDSSVYDGQIRTEENTLAVMLLDETSDIPESLHTYKKVRKYQRISRIYQQILELYSEICGEADGVLGGNGVRTIAFYSPIGGAGKTTVALASAARLAKMGYRVFYMSLEDIASEDCYLPQGNERGLSEVVACLGEKINFTMKLQSLLQNKDDKLFYLNHFESPNDIYEMHEEEIAELLEQIGKTGLFDVIIVDTGISLDKKMVALFENMDKVVIVEKEDAISLRKLKCFLEQSHIMNEYAHKMCRVINFDIGRGSMLTNTNIPVIGKIDAVQNPEPAQFIAMLANAAECSFVSQLVN